MKRIIITFLSLIAPSYFLTATTAQKVKVENTASIRKSLATAKSVHIYEGLPHQMVEAEQLQQELKRADITKIGDFPFYTPKVTASPTMSAELKKVLASAEHFFEFSGEKRCGGFHPDYAITWSKDQEEHAVLICYGCHEALFITDQQTYRYDLHPDALSKLKSSLASFHSKRPE